MDSNGIPNMDLSSTKEKTENYHFLIWQYDDSPADFGSGLPQTDPCGAD
jgi:hypothetical protein